MQKKYLITALLAFITTMSVSSGVAYAATNVGTKTGTIEYLTGTDTVLPVNPEQPDPNNPVSPINPDGSTPLPGTGGPLSIDFASSFDFGTQPISNKDVIYYAKAQSYTDGTADTPNYVQVTDSRGTNAGWVLQVLQSGQLTEVGKGQYSELKGAVISLNNPFLASNGDATAPVASSLSLVPGQEAVLATAAAGSGAGTWCVRWGDTTDLTKDADRTVSPDVQLFVPGSTPKDAAKYTTTINWKLSELPQNQ